MRLKAVLCSAVLGFGATDAVHAQTSDQIREAQSLLVRVDRQPGPADGVWGRRTEAALVDFLAERRLDFDGELTDEHLALLRVAPEGPEFVRREIGLKNTLPRSIRENRNQPESEGLTVYESWELPAFVNPNPNLTTLRFYLSRHLLNVEQFGHFTARPASEPRSIAFQVTPNRYLTAQMNHTALTSYLFYRDGAVVHDEISPEFRFGHAVANDIGLRSNSVGKSLVGYLLGHAICEGHINGIDARLDDWPLMSDTLYGNQRVKDIADMRAGDQGVVDDLDGLISSGRWYNGVTVGSFATYELPGTRPTGQEGKRAYHYNGLATNILMNYVIHKVDGDFEDFMDRVFRDHVGIENEVLFFRTRLLDLENGPAWYQFYATRHDYLRIAMTMLEDWESGNCVGQFLKDTVARSLPKNNRNRRAYRAIDSALRYANQLHAGYVGMENRNVLGMHGFGGQNILVDFDNGRIAVANSVHFDYDYYRLVHLAIQNGKLP